MGRSVLFILLATLLTGCPGGGDGGGGGGTTPTGTPAQTIVSGSVQAPAGQIVFSKEKSFGDLFVSEAYAALSGLATVPDNTIVQLARLSSNATTFTVLSTTATSGGRYSFNLTALGLGPAHDLIVRVAGPSGKEMRAFVSGTVADITPVSEAACQLIVQVLVDGPLANLTIQEISDIHRAVELIAAVQDIGTATSLDQAVNLVKTAVAGNAQVTGFIAATGAIGQTTQGTGDIGNFFPYSDGNLWEYKNTTSIPFSNTLTVAGTRFIDAVPTTVFRESNPENDGRPQESYAVKAADGITWYGNNDPTDSVTSQLVPYQPIHFPLPFGNPFVSVSRKRVIINGQAVDYTEESRAVGLENVTVPAGSFPNALKLERTQTFLLGGTDTPIVTGKETTWLVRNRGQIKRSLVVEGGGQTATDTEELVRSVIDGVEELQGARIRKLPLQTRDLVYDPLRNIIYASLPGNPGHIITIDPVAGTIGTSINVGNEPNKLAISHDAQFLYVGLDGEAAIRRIDLASFTTNLLIPLGMNPYAPSCGQLVVGDMQVVPGFPNSVAVSKYSDICTPRFAQLAVYDDAIRRPNVIERTSDALGLLGGLSSDFIEFSNSPAILYGFDTLQSQIYTFSITSLGVALSTRTSFPLGVSVTDMKFDGNRLYMDKGHVVDPVSGTITGQFEGTSSTGSVVRPDSTVGRTFFLPRSSNCGPFNLLAFDRFQPLGSVPIQVSGCVFFVGDLGSLIRWGSNGLAFRRTGRTEGEVVLLNTAFIP
jgi:hypothetical protein